MESKVKAFGHPIHPMLIVFPLGLLATSLIFDIIHWITGNGFFSVVAFWMITAGVIGALLAAIFGLIDWLAIPVGTRAKTVGLWHGGGNVFIVLLFIHLPEPLVRGLAMADVRRERYRRWVHLR